MPNPKKMVLGSIDPMSLAKILAVMGIIWGLVIAVVSLLFAPMQSYMGRFYAGFEAMGLGAFGIILLPIYYAIIGFIGGYIGAWIYNYVVKFVGGVKIELK